MQNPTDKGNFVEFTDFSLILARTASLRSPYTLEELREVSLDNKASLEEAVHAVFPETQSGGKAAVIASLRPKQRWMHFSTGDEAKKYTTLATLPAALNEPALAGNPPSEFT